jgi:hypothetical protein
MEGRLALVLSRKFENVKLRNVQLMGKSANGLHSEFVHSLVDSEHSNELDSALCHNTVENNVKMFNYFKSNHAR